MTARVATRPQKPNEQQKEKLQNLNIQKLAGDAARLRAKQLRKLNKGVARAMKDAEKKGLREAFDQGAVILGTDPGKAANGLMPGFRLNTKASFLTSPQDS